MKKPNAGDRTISFLDGKTQEEKDNEAERIRQGLDLVATPKEPVTIEKSADRWRAQAFAGQCFLTDAFGDPGAIESQFRITLDKGMAYVETCKASEKSNGAYSYSGVMMPESDLPRFAEVIVKATREYLKKTKGIGK